MCQMTVATIWRTDPPGGTVTEGSELNFTAPPRPVIEVPGSRNRPSVTWLPSAEAVKNSVSGPVSAACVAVSLLVCGGDGGTAVLGAGSHAGSPEITAPPADTYTGTPSSISPPFTRASSVTTA